MGIYLGIDLGTSSVKALLLDGERGVLAAASCSYSMDLPRLGWVQQDVQTWWSACVNLLARLRIKNPNAFREISAIGLSGQMHGLVCLDEQYAPLYPAILWMDQRSASQAEAVARILGSEELQRRIHNRIPTGFALPSLLWLKEHESILFRHIRHVAAPKDYIRLMLTGTLGAEASDASASGFFDVRAGRWADDLLQRLELNPTVLPPCSTATKIAGQVTQSCARETGLPVGIPVVYGAGDHLAQCIGNGACEEGRLICNIGTGGQISSFSQQDRWDTQLRTHTFRHVLPDRFVVLGASLGSGLSLNWFSQTFLSGQGGQEISALAKYAPPGSSGLLYLPYLTGERTPYMDPAACGLFFGMRLAHRREHFARAVMEGVTFSLLQSLELLDELGLHATQIIASGGGAKSPLWLQMQADVFGREILVNQEDAQGCLGACILAAVGIGDFPGVAAATGHFVRFKSRRFQPDTQARAIYLEQYSLYKQLYRQNRVLMHGLNRALHRQEGGGFI